MAGLISEWALFYKFHRYFPVKFEAQRIKASHDAVFFRRKPLYICLGNAPRKDARTPEKLLFVETLLILMLGLHIHKFIVNNTYIFISVKKFFIN